MDNIKIPQEQNLYEVLTVQKVDLKEFGYTSTCEVHYIHTRVSEIQNIAYDMVQKISSNCWTFKLLDEDYKDSYWACAKPTIDHLVNNILSEVLEKDTVTSKFGEYLISIGSQVTLEQTFNHESLPIAELWKEQLTGNPGFDFHTLTNTDFLAYGEAKFNAKNNPYSEAIEQISSFITDEKDLREYKELKNINTKVKSKHKLKENKAFIAAFSLNAQNYKLIFENALKHEDIKKLIEYPELYLIGIEICHQDK